MEGHLPSFAGATGWLNSEPLTPRGCGAGSSSSTSGPTPASTGCARCPTSAPGTRSTRTQGLTTIGVHTPEFDFEHDVDNIIAQARALSVPYPIAVDSDYGVWNAFDNHYWPAVYIADAQGRIRYHHFGEGEYAMQEMVIQQLLLEAGAKDVDPDLVVRRPGGARSGGRLSDPALPGDVPGVRPGDRAGLAGWLGPMSRTTTPRHRAWVSTSGRRRAAGRSRGAPPRRRRRSPARLPLPGPRCEPGDGAGRRAAPRSPSASPSTASRPTGAHGTDVDADGTGTVDGAADLPTHPRNRPRSPSAPVEIEFLAPGVELFCFTFG